MMVFYAVRYERFRTALLNGLLRGGNSSAGRDASSS
ncbi:hypothetical protein D2E22_0592 [Bifidobacterium castoris]|uniref:Uncharacterized protein n=1 Tax=Bifidobacterium castoris TaxID=2306972 RepID=A0A430F8M1_9BIFI|nr:hypothetical protein D2E22_0592 [Bifidobacterium castoris]